MSDGVDEPMPDIEDEEAVISEILARHEVWKQARETVKTQMQNIKLAESKLSIAHDPILLEDDRLREAVTEMIQLDSIIREKNLIVKALKYDRLVREDPSIQTSANVEESDDDDDIKSIDMQSVHSLDTRTFITEPKLMIKRKMGDSRSAGGSSKTNKEHYTKGDFILRNILLGPDARFYDAMTQDEKERVELIISSSDDTFIGGEHKELRLQNSFISLDQDFQQLVEIERKLKDVSIVDDKYLITESISASRPSETYMALRDVHIVLADVDALKEDIFKDEVERIKDIDHKLEILKQRPEDDPAVENPESAVLPEKPLFLSEDVIKQLIQDCLKEQFIIESRKNSTMEFPDDEIPLPG